jgi:ribosome recycling factor
VNQGLSDSKKNMEKAIEHLKGEFAKLRVGRATTSMVEGVKVEVYGSAMTLKEVAAITIPDAKTIAMQPWDRSVINEIEKGILAANLGLTPINDGKLIRVNLPPMTEERRKDFVKQIKKYGEDAKVAIRNTRRDSIDKFKGSDASEDETRQFQNEVQKLTDHFSQEVDKLVDAKSKEVMTL